MGNRSRVNRDDGQAIARAAPNCEVFRFISLIDYIYLYSAYMGRTRQVAFLKPT